ncbi:MAG TPA: hypothetical protein DD761_11200 [Cyanobacteria bacterium UBA11691]|nr:hypothetical protein [Cyanobacteria bacterium UBA11691]
MNCPHSQSLSGADSSRISFSAQLGDSDLYSPSQASWVEEEGEEFRVLRMLSIVGCFSTQVDADFFSVSSLNLLLLIFQKKHELKI